MVTRPRPSAASSRWLQISCCYRDVSRVEYLTEIREVETSDVAQSQHCSRGTTVTKAHPARYWLTSNHLKNDKPPSLDASCSHKQTNIKLVPVTDYFLHRSLSVLQKGGERKRVLFPYSPPGPRSSHWDGGGRVSPDQTQHQQHRLNDVQHVFLLWRFWVGAQRSSEIGQNFLGQSHHSRFSFTCLDYEQL